MKTVEKIIKDLELQDIKRLGERTGKNVTMTQILTDNSKIKFEYDKDGRLLSKTTFENDKEKSKDEYKYENNNMHIFYSINGKFDSNYANIISTINHKNGDISIKNTKICNKDDEKIQFVKQYEYININGLNILKSLISKDIPQCSNSDNIERLLELVNSTTKFDQYDGSKIIELTYMDPINSIITVIIQINRNGFITDMSTYYIDDNNETSKTYIKYKDGFLNEIKYIFTNHLKWEYTTTTTYDYENMTKTDETTMVKKNK